MMFCWCALGLLTLVPVVTGNNAGVKVTITQRGLDYAAINLINQLVKMDIPDYTKELLWIKIVQIKGLKFQNLEKIGSVLNVIPGTGVSITIQSTDLHLSGNVKIKMMKNRTFDLTLTSLSIKATVAVKTEKNGRPALSMNECKAEIGNFKISLKDPNSVLNALTSYIERHGNELICSRLTAEILNFNKQLAKLKATISKDVEIDYSVSSAVISGTSIELGLKGVFYNTEQVRELHFSPPAFPLASKNTKMFYFAISAFTINSAFLAFHDAGKFTIQITDDMIPSVSLIHLSTTTIGAFIPQISVTYPDLKVQLVVKTVEGPVIKLEPQNLNLELLCTVTAYAVQSDNTLTQLFVLNLEGSASVQVSVTEDKLALAFTHEKFKTSVKETNVGKFEVTKLNTFLNMVIKDVAFPIINAHLLKGISLAAYPLPSFIGKVHLENTQVEVFKDYMLIETDVRFEENTSS